MIAEQLDLDLGPHAARIQDSFLLAWRNPEVGAPIFLGLAWAYEDTGCNYAAEEAKFLWEFAYSRLRS